MADCRLRIDRQAMLSAISYTARDPSAGKAFLNCRTGEIVQGNDWIEVPKCKPDTRLEGETEAEFLARFFAASGIDVDLR